MDYALPWPSKAIKSEIVLLLLFTGRRRWTLHSGTSTPSRSDFPPPPICQTKRYSVHERIQY